jgi:glycosyltransferase involved in cell wall biosynthesis
VIPRKGVLVLLEALLQLPAGTCQLAVIGNTDLDELHMRVVYHLFMVTRLPGVTLAGVVSDAELAAILAHSHVLVVPSEYEGFGIVYLEGMGFGLPAIGTTSGAAREIVADGVNGYLVPPNDPAALAKCLAGLASDRDQLAHLGLAARERFLAQPSWHDSMARVRQALLDWTSGLASES